MDYFMEFHWWYIPVGIILMFLVFGKRKGGVVVKGLTANLDVLDERFQGCRPEADYNIFEEGKPHHIDIEIDDLSIPVGEELELLLNGLRFAMVEVKRNQEAEFDHWSGDGVDFPQVNEGDELLVRYQGADVLKGTFRLK